MPLLVLWIDRMRLLFLVTGQKQDGVDYAFTREQDVDLALFPLHDVKQPVEFVEIGRVTKACLVAPQGFEPRLIGSEPTVLPLNEGAKRH